MRLSWGLSQAGQENHQPDARVADLEQQAWPKGGNKEEGAGVHRPAKVMQWQTQNSELQSSLCHL